MKTLEEWKAYYRDKYPNKSDKNINDLAQKAFDNQQVKADITLEVPTLGGTKKEEQANTRNIPVGFGLTDPNGDTLYLPPTRFPSFMQELLLTNSDAYEKIQTAVYEASGKRYSEPDALGKYLETVAQNQLLAGRKNPSIANFDIEKILNVGIANRKSNPIFAKNAGKYTPLDIEAVSGETTAQKLITDVWKKQLNREPTAEEIDLYTGKLQKAQRKNPAKQTYEMVGGKRVQKTLTGLNEEQYLTNQARKLPEYSKKTAEAAKIKEQNRQLNLQELSKTAIANGFNINTDFASNIQDWLNQIDNGANIETFKNLIRQNAQVGRPENIKNMMAQGIDLESVYAPYKKAMATVLEIPYDSITLDDPTLQGAISGDKEMTIYEFQRALRKDPRWQYTDNARETVSTAALGILRDFGFQG